MNSLSIAIRELTERDQDREAYDKLMNELEAESEANLASKIKAGDFDDNFADIHKNLSEIEKETRRIKPCI